MQVIGTGMRVETGDGAVPEGTWRFDVLGIAGVVLAVATSLLLSGDRVAAGIAVLAGGLASLAALACTRASGRLVDRATLRLGGLAVGNLAAGALLAFVPGEPVRFGYVFIVAAAAATVGNSPRRQLPLHVLGPVAFVVGAIAGGSALSTEDVLLYGALLGAASYLLTSLSDPLWSRRVADEQSRDALRSRTRLLAAIGRTVDLDADSALRALVEAVVELDFDKAQVTLIRDDHRYPVASVGFDRPVPPLPVTEGVGGQVIAEGRPVVVADYASHPRRVDGREHAGAVAAVPIRRDDRIVGVLVAASDESHVIPDADVGLLEVLAEHAAHALANAERFADQQELVIEMRRLDELKREFVGNVSHELRTPLTVVKGLGRTLVDRRDELDETRSAELLARLNDNARRLSMMLSGLLDFSEGSERGLRASRRPVDLVALVTGVVERMRPLFAGTPIAVDLADHALVSADPRLIEHVLENLLANAVKHTPDGTAVSIRVVRADEGVLVEVADAGPGIPEDEVPRLTERFYRGSAARTASEGSGVGLDLVARVLEAHGSALDVESSPGSGSRFRFHLPRASERPA